MIQEHQAVVNGLDFLVPQIHSVANRMSEALDDGGKIIWMGNGGSAADSQHLAAELIGRFKRERRAIASISLSVDTSVLTALGNDYGYDTVFRRQIEALCSEKDVVVGISTSGNSKNVLAAIELAKDIGAYTVGFTGVSGGELIGQVDACFPVPSSVTSRIQESHILIGHIICELVELDVVKLGD